jgi:lysophospholipid acyltransferase (LPLAT)-like uncharacterized protein
MNRKQAKTLHAVFRDPVSATIAWNDIASLMEAVGCKTVQGSGSRVRFAKGEEIETFHRPRPEKEAKRYQVRAARDFLKRLGVEP